MSSKFGQTVRVVDPNWNGMVKVEWGVNREVKSFEPHHLERLDMDATTTWQSTNRPTRAKSWMPLSRPPANSAELPDDEDLELKGQLHSALILDADDRL